MGDTKLEELLDENGFSEDPREEDDDVGDVDDVESDKDDEEEEEGCKFIVE